MTFELHDHNYKLAFWITEKGTNWPDVKGTEVCTRCLTSKMTLISSPDKSCDKSLAERLERRILGLPIIDWTFIDET